MSYLTIKIQNAEYPCPACGKLVELDFEYKLGQSGEINCPWCGESVFLQLSFALVDVFYVRSNSEVLLDMAGVEKDQAEDIKEIKAEERTAEVAQNADRKPTAHVGKN